MKNSTRIAVAASIAAAAALLSSVPGTAQANADTLNRVMHDREPGWPGSDRYEPRNNRYNIESPGTTETGVPEPSVLALLAIGLGGLAVSVLSRRRVKA